MVGSPEDRNQQKYLGEILFQVFLFSMFRMTLLANCRSVSLLEKEGSSIENLMRAHLALAQFADKKFKQVLSKVTILENCALL